MANKVANRADNHSLSFLHCNLKTTTAKQKCIYFRTPTDVVLSTTSTHCSLALLGRAKQAAYTKPSGLISSQGRCTSVQCASLEVKLIQDNFLPFALEAFNMHYERGWPMDNNTALLVVLHYCTLHALTLLLAPATRRR